MLFMSVRPVSAVSIKSSIFTALKTVILATLVALLWQIMTAAEVNPDMLDGTNETADNIYFENPSSGSSVKVRKCPLRTFAL